MAEDRESALFRKIAEVMGTVTTLPKRGTFQGKNFSYKYVIASDVYDAVRSELAKRQVAVLPSIINREVEGDTTILKLNVTFADGETGQCFSVQWMGEAWDGQDKGVNKAFTAGMKYGLLKMFLVSSGEEDADSVEPEQETISDPDEARAITFPFGKHKGKTVGEVIDNDPGYVNWAMKQKDVLRGKLKAAAEFLSGMSKPPTEDSGEPATEAQIKAVRGVMASVFDLDSTDTKAINAKLNRNGYPDLAELSKDQAAQIIANLQKVGNQRNAGNGKSLELDPEQPQPPMRVKQVVNSVNDKRPASQKQAGLIASVLNGLLEQAEVLEEDRDDARHAVQKWLCGSESASDFTKGQVKGILDLWVSLGEDYEPTRKAAVQEIKAIYARAMNE